MVPADYTSWSKEELIARLTELEAREMPPPDIKDSQVRRPPPPAKAQKVFRFSNHPTRKIALKFCYSGWEYNGLEFQKDATRLPTVEDVLFKALAKTKLIDEDGGFEACGWEKCGRTDIGVSAAGQVVSLWIRSAFEENRGARIPQSPPEDSSDNPNDISAVSAEDATEDVPPDFTSLTVRRRPTNELRGLRYVTMLNRVLPPTVRVLAWSPVEPTFSARFNCRHRHYKYFFPSRELDISLMQQAADYLVGEHDFRNMCKLDPSKQITNFKRRILKAQIEAVGQENSNMYVFNLVGSAFLYHQVRHIMAILFLVGTGLEPPSVVLSLINTDADAAQELGLSADMLVDCKPVYQMAEALPLMLWDCVYSDTDVDWHIDFEDKPAGAGADLHSQMQSVYDRSQIHAALDGHFLASATRYHRPAPICFPFSQTGLSPASIPRVKESTPPVLSIPLGGGTFKRQASYVPLLQRKRMVHVDIVNAKWLEGKGGRRESRK
ncbi:pseudouridine synthase, partial [Coniophora puteana RWD-64-598 SS2]